MPDKIVNHFVLADGSVARYSVDGLSGEIVDSYAREQINILNSDIAEINDILEIEETTKQGTATHTTSTSSPATVLISDITLEQGQSYTISISIDEAISKTIYLYLSDENSTNIATSSISSGSTSCSRTFTATNDYSNCALKFGVALANVTATGTITKNGEPKPNAIERLESEISDIEEQISSSDSKSIASFITGDIASGENLLLEGKSAIKDGQAIVFKSGISSFNKLKLNFTGYYSTNYIEVDNTNIAIKNSTSEPVTSAHGLSIVNDITLIVRIINAHALVSLTSNGVTYSTDVVWSQTGASPSEYQIESTGTTCTSAKLSSVYYGCLRKIWYFGDSYIAFGTDTRIPYYVYEYGCGEHILFSGASGGTSGLGMVSLNTLLLHGKPKFAVWATGMNDGADSETAPHQGWLNNVNNFITLCENNGITPILCTIPTVPSVNNEQKNTWVRNSGYRYIDYASAVGANANGEWYSGMLSTDNIHPSTLGGNALFTELAKDLPEIFS